MLQLLAFLLSTSSNFLWFSTSFSRASKNDCLHQTLYCGSIHLFSRSQRGRKNSSNTSTFKTYRHNFFGWNGTNTRIIRVISVLCFVLFLFLYFVIQRVFKHINAFVAVDWLNSSSIVGSTTRRNNRLNFEFFKTNQTTFWVCRAVSCFLTCTGLSVSQFSSPSGQSTFLPFRSCDSSRW
jgi:hypothetical protein